MTTALWALCAFAVGLIFSVLPMMGWWRDAHWLMHERDEARNQARMAREAWVAWLDDWRVLGKLDLDDLIAHCDERDQELFRALRKTFGEATDGSAQHAPR